MTPFQPYNPVVPSDLYPNDWSTISDFSYDDHLYLARANKAIASSRKRETQYLVAADYRVSFRIDGQQQRTAITVPSGMLTDLASVPRLARPLVGRVGPHLEASIVHDFLFLAWQDIPGHGARKKDFHFANEVMHQAMIAAKVGGVGRTIILAAVSSFVGWWIYEEPNKGPRYVHVPCPCPADGPGYGTLVAAADDTTASPTDSG